MSGKIRTILVPTLRPTNEESDLEFENEASFGTKTIKFQGVKIIRGEK